MNARRPGRWQAPRQSASPELPEIIIIRRQDSGGFSRIIRREAGLVRLHGAVEIIELRVLAEASRIDFGGVGIGLRADDLGALGAFRPDRQRFLLARGAHALESALQRRA